MTVRMKTRRKKAKLTLGQKDHLRWMKEVKAVYPEFYNHFKSVITPSNLEDHLWSFDVKKHSKDLGKVIKENKENND